MCGWKLPPRLTRADHARRMLHAHHVIPLAFGGDDSAANLVLLCPNHHAIAHALGDYKPSGMPSRSGWYGPLTREAMIHEIRLLQRGSAAEWERWVAGGRNWHQHLEDLDIMRERRFSVVR